MERIFVRSSWQITYDSKEATGKRSTESECIKEFGKEKWEQILKEMDDRGAAVLPDFFNEGIF